jgi:YVTN family beta-propeller protein
MLSTRAFSTVRACAYIRPAHIINVYLLGLMFVLLHSAAAAQDQLPWNRLYVTNHLSNSVSVIDLRMGRILTTIPVGAGPMAIAVTPDRQRVYVGNHLGGSISVISTASNMVEQTIEIPGAYGRSAPLGLAITPDGGKLYVSSASDGIVTVIEVGSHRIIKRITEAYDWALRNLAVSPDGSFVYALGSGDNKISVIEVSEDKVIARITGIGAPYHLVFAPDGRRAYVTSDKLHRLYVLDAKEHRLLNTVQFPHGSATITVDITPNGKLAYVSNFYGKLSAVSLKEGSRRYLKVVGEVPPNSLYQYCVIVGTTGQFAYLSNQAERGPSPNSINIIDIRPGSPTRHTIVASIPVGQQPWGVVAVNEPDQPNRTP